jgi:hypothetical protein
MSTMPRPLQRLVAVAAACVIAAALSVVFTQVTSAGGAAKISSLAYRSNTSKLRPDSRTHSVVARCPSGLHVLGGGIKLRDPDADAAEGSFPRHKDSWVAQGIRFASSAGKSRFTSYAICGR